MIMAASTLYIISAIFMMKFGMMICAYWNPNETENQNNLAYEYNRLTKTHPDITHPPEFRQQIAKLPSPPPINLSPVAPKIEEKPTNVLSRNRFTSQVSHLLPPEMFSQADPVLFLLQKTTQLQSIEITSINDNLRHIPEDEFPTRYVPYARVLAAVIKTERVLQPAVREILQIRRSPNTDQVFPPACVSLSSKLSALFSRDILLDSTNVLFGLMIKFIDMSEDEILDAKNTLNYLLLNNEIPRNGQYFQYAQGLQNFLNNKFFIRDLKRSISELRNFSSSELSSETSKDSNTDRKSLPAMTVPLFKP